MNTKFHIVDPHAYQLPSPPVWMESWLFRWRVLLFALLYVWILVIDYYVEPFSTSAPGNSEMIEDIVFFTAILSVGILAEILLRTVVAKSHTLEILEIKHELSSQLEMAQDGDKLVELILSFCAAVTDPDKVALLLNTKSGGYEVAALSQSRRYLDAYEGITTGEDDYCICAEATAKTLHEIQPSSNMKDGASAGYCVPLITGERIIAKLNFFLPSGRSLGERQASILKNCASDIAFALAMAQVRKTQAELLIDQARNVQRHETSRNIHDALGQKLIYLRFKLDQLFHGSEDVQLSCIRPDLEQMLAAANESCQLVRGTLAVLNSSGSPSLQRLLVEHSRLTVDRSQWEITFMETGPPRMLSPEILQQILYIFGEALSNIERHAAAQEVAVELLWGESELAIKVADDGRGFEPTITQKEGHYGLTFMRERVEALGGCMDLRATLNKGTRLTIQLPIRDN